MKRETTFLLTVVLALTLIGILMVYSASGVGTRAAERLRTPSPFYYVNHQLIFVAVGLFGMFVASRIDYHRLASPLYFRAIVMISLVLLVLVLIPGIGAKSGGARRWIQVPGFRFQPSEFAKFAVILLLSVKLSQNQQYIRRFWRGIVPPAMITGVFLVLILAEHDLGVPVVIGSVSLLMLFMAGIPKRYFFAALGAGGAGVGALIYLSPNRMERMLAFLNPWADPSDTGLQLIQSLAAFAQGSIYGRGPGASEQKLNYLPAAHTDFIFAVWGEEMGLVGCLALIALFVAFLIVGVRIISGARDSLGALLAGGIISLVSFQAAFNMAVTIGLLPTKGLPLPFISSGGSAVIVYLTMIGVLLNIGLQAEEPERAGAFAPTA
jgi:cell division protein FtsW